MLPRVVFRLISQSSALRTNLLHHNNFVRLLAKKNDDTFQHKKQNSPKVYQTNRKQERKQKVKNLNITESLNCNQSLKFAYGLYFGGQLSLTEIKKYYAEHNLTFNLRTFLKGEYQETVLTKNLQDGLTSDIFIFEEQGCCVFWNCTPQEIDDIKDMMNRCLTSPSDEYSGESETLNYSYTDDDKSTFSNNVLKLGRGDWESKLIDKYSASYSMVLAILTSIGEEKVDHLFDNIEEVDPSYLINPFKDFFDHRHRSTQKLHKSLNELCLQCNLEYNLLNEPDYLWEYENQSHLFHQLKVYLQIGQRLKGINTELGYLEKYIQTCHHYSFESRESRLTLLIIILLAADFSVNFLNYLTKTYTRT